MTARPICLRLLTHCERRAASRAACTAGSRRAIRTAMIAITTSNSIRVKARGRAFMGLLLRRGEQGRLGDVEDEALYGQPVIRSGPWAHLRLLGVVPARAWAGSGPRRTRMPEKT